MDRLQVALELQTNELARRYRKMARMLANLVDTRRAEDTFYRASGQCECLICDLPYEEHPEIDGVGLVLLCNGDWVKL